MNAPVEPAIHRWPGWVTWLRRELAPTPGRDLATVRMVVVVALVTIVSMALQVPETAISAYMVVFVTKENRVLTTLAGAIAILGVTIAIAASLLIYRATFDYPVLRVSAMTAAVFAGMFLARVFAVGPLGFAIGFVVALTQSASDGVPDAERLVRGLLWLWVALVYPIVLTVIVNQCLLPAEPWTAFVRALDRRLDFAAQTLRQAAEHGAVGGSSDAAALELATQGSAPLLKLLGFAEGRNARLKPRHAPFLAAVAACEQLARSAAALVLGRPATLTENDRSRARQLENYLHELRRFLLSPSHGQAMAGLDRSPADLFELRELQFAIFTLADSFHQSLSDDVGSLPAKTAPRKPLLVPDAFTNPAHVHFALKVTLAAMSCYVLYMGTDWPGIHTAFITCCIIALESAGATRRKGWLRLAGCCVGGLLGFLSIMYLVPFMESIVSLVLLVSAVTALAGWVAAGGERIAYAGLQIALAFYLGIFQGFAPGTDFDKIRDRLMGIILGIVVSSVVFRYVWPERARDRLRVIVARGLRALAALVRLPAPDAAAEATAKEVNRLSSGIATDLDEAGRLVELASFEEPIVSTADHLSARQLTSMVRHARAVFLIGDRLASASGLDGWTHLSAAGRNEEVARRDDAAVCLDRVADLLDAPSVTVPENAFGVRVVTETGVAKGRAYLLLRLSEQVRQLVPARPGT